MKHTLIAAFLVACLATVAVQSQAADKKTPKGAAKQTPEQLFAKLDSDGDKFLSPEELAAWAPAAAKGKAKGGKGQGGSDDAAATQKKLGEFDSNKDGKLSLNEFLTARLVLTAKKKK